MFDNLDVSLDQVIVTLIISMHLIVVIHISYVCVGGLNFIPPPNFVLGKWEGITDALAEVNVEAG